MPAPRASHTGITARHRNSCPAAEDAGAGCRCSPTYRAQVYDMRTGRKLRKSFPSFAAARAWRSDAEVALRQGKITSALSPHLSDAAAAWLDGALAGAIRNRSGDRYKPSVLRQYETTLRLRLLPEFGAVRLSELQRKDLQGYVDRLLLDGVHNPSTIRNTLVPLRVIFRRAVVRGEVAVTPTIGLEIPAARGRRERIASPAEAEQFRSPAPASGPSRWRRCSAPTWSNSAWCPVDRRPCRRPRARLPVPAQDPERPRAARLEESRHETDRPARVPPHFEYGVLDRA
jgi:hypothetical protein